MSLNPTRVKLRAKRALRTRGATALGRLPVGPGRAGQLVGRARVAEAGRVLKAGGDAEAVVAPLLAAETDPRIRGRAWALVAEARSSAGQHTRALEAARVATALDDDVETSLTHHRLARRTAPAEAASALVGALGQRPRNRKQIDLVVEALRSADREALETWRAHLAGWGIEGSRSDWPRSRPRSPSSRPTRSSRCSRTGGPDCAGRRPPSRAPSTAAATGSAWPTRSTRTRRPRTTYRRW